MHAVPDRADLPQSDAASLEGTNHRVLVDADTELAERVAADFSDKGKSLRGMILHYSDFGDHGYFESKIEGQF